MGSRSRWSATWPPGRPKPGRESSSRGAVRHVPYFTAIWAVSNFARPVVLGHFFDSVSRKLMITATYVGSGLLAAVMEVVMLTGSDSLWLFEFCLS